MGENSEKSLFRIELIQSDPQFHQSSPLILKSVYNTAVFIYLYLSLPRGELNVSHSSDRKSVLLFWFAYVYP